MDLSTRPASPQTHGKEVPAEQPKGEAVRVSAFVLFARECAKEIKKEFSRTLPPGRPTRAARA